MKRRSLTVWLVIATVVAVGVFTSMPLFNSTMAMGGVYPPLGSNCDIYPGTLWDFPGDENVQAYTAYTACTISPDTVTNGNYDCPNGTHTGALNTCYPDEAQTTEPTPAATPSSTTCPDGYIPDSNSEWGCTPTSDGGHSTGHNGPDGMVDDQGNPVIVSDDNGVCPVAGWTSGGYANAKCWLAYTEELTEATPDQEQLPDQTISYDDDSDQQAANTTSDEGSDSASTSPQTASVSGDGTAGPAYYRLPHTGSGRTPSNPAPIIMLMVASLVLGLAGLTCQAYQKEFWHDRSAR